MMITDFLAAMPLPALVIDSSERIIRANDPAQDLLGKQIETRHFATILRQPSVFRAIDSCLRTRSPHTARHLSADIAQDQVFDVNVSYVRADDADAAGWVLVMFQDVSHIEQVGQMRRDFVANVSHELRTPLTALMGFIETLRGAARNDPAAQKRFLDIMEVEASRMNRLIGDLLSLSRVESEERMRPRDTVMLNQVLDSTARSLKPVFEDAKVDLDVQLPEEPVTVQGDPDQLQQVFTNLLENAVKYGGSGQVVTVTLTRLERDSVLRCPAALVCVADQGQGIDSVHLPRLTERFYRVDTHRSREVGGTGLGLAIVKHIVNRHRGRLKIESELGNGTQFSIFLPIG